MSDYKKSTVQIDCAIHTADIPKDDNPNMAPECPPTPDKP